jgi:hypothetical protein
VHQGRDESAQGLGDQHEVRPVRDHLDHLVGVVNQPGRLVVARQLHAQRVVPAPAEFALCGVPVPGVAARSRDQHVVHSANLL